MANLVGLETSACADPVSGLDTGYGLNEKTGFEEGLPKVAPEDIARAVEAESRKRPEILFGLAMSAFAERRKHETEMAEASLQYFGVFISRMKHAVWIGDIKSERTAFAFVDYSSPAAGVFLKGLDAFASKGKVRIAVLPASLDEKSKAAALIVASVATNGQSGTLGNFVATLENKGDHYDGDPLSVLSEKDRGAILSGAEDAEVIEQVSVVRLAVMALDLPQPLALVMESRRYVGNLGDGEEMAAFYAPSPVAVGSK